MEGSWVDDTCDEGLYKVYKVPYGEKGREGRFDRFDRASERLACSMTVGGVRRDMSVGGVCVSSYKDNNDMISWHENE